MSQPPTGPIPIIRPIDSLRAPGAGGPVGAAFGLQLTLWLQSVLIVIGVGVAIVETAYGEALPVLAPTGTAGLAVWIAVFVVEPGLAVFATFVYRSRRAAVRNLAQVAGSICAAGGLVMTVEQHVFGVAWLLYGVLVLMLADHASTRAYFTH